MTAVISVVAAGLAWSNQEYLAARTITLVEAIRRPALKPDEEHALSPGRTFRECAHCPEMVVLPSDKFDMGSTNRAHALRTGV